MDDTTPIKRSFSPYAPLAAGVFLVGAVVIVAFLVREAFHKSAADREKQLAKQLPTNQKGTGNGPEPKQIDPIVMEEKLVLARVRTEGIRNLHRDISGELTKLETDVIVWEARLPELMTGDTGKRIAASRIRAEQFANVIARKRVSPTQVRDLRARLDLLIKPINRSLLDPNSSYYASEAIVSEVESVGDEVRIASREIREIKLIVDTLQTASMGVAPAQKTLHAVLDEIDAERLQRRLEVVAKSNQAVYEAETKRIVENDAKVEKEVADARIAIQNAKASIELQAMQDRIGEYLRQQQQAAEAEKKRSEKLRRVAKFEAAYPSMEPYLVPITSHGLAQFNGNWLELTTTKGPMSLNALLGNVKKGKNETGLFARSLSNQHNDRPQGAFPKYWTGGLGQTSANFEIWFGVQDFIAEYGDIMVERKLLAP